MVQCPICTLTLERGELLMVCGNCHDTLGGGKSALKLGATGEFRVPTAEMVAAMAEAPAGERPNATDTCSWCHKRERDVKKLLGRAGTALCNECVALACDIMDAELGNWR